jgi:hypothetical protein
MIELDLAALKTLAKTALGEELGTAVAAEIDRNATTGLGTSTATSQPTTIELDAKTVAEILRPSLKSVAKTHLGEALGAAVSNAIDRNVTTENVSVLGTMFWVMCAVMRSMGYGNKD